MIHILELCAVAKQQFSEAVYYGEKLIQLRPSDLKCYNRLERYYTKHLNQPDRADRIMQSMIDANPGCVEAYYRRACYSIRRGALQQAQTDLDLILRQLDTQNLQAILVLADVYRQQAKLDEARALLQQAQSKLGSSCPLYQALARLEIQAGRFEYASRYIQNTLPLLQNDDDYWTTINLLLDIGDVSQARQLLARRIPASSDDDWYQFLQARIDLISGNFSSARTQFEQMLGNLTHRHELTYLCGLNLAYCYGQQGDLDSQLRTYRHLLTIDADAVLAKMGLARTMAELGRYDEAISMYLKIAETTPTVRLLTARLLLQRAVWNPEQTQDLTEALRLVEAVPEPLRHSIDARLLRVQILVVNGQCADAENELNQLLKIDSDHLESRLLKATLIARNGDRQQALKLLERIKHDLGDSVDLRLTHAALIQTSPLQQYLASLSELAQNRNQFPRDEQIRLLNGLIPYYLRIDAIRQVQELCQSLLTIQPNHLQTHHLLLRLALQAGDEQQVEKCTETIRRIEGKDGPLALYAQAARIVRFAQADQRALLDEAAKLLQQARVIRPRWAPLALLEASLAERLGQPTLAIRHYRRAIEAGERHPDVIRRLVSLLQRHHHHDEAHALLVSLREQRALPPEFDRLTVETALLCRVPADAVLDLAERSVSTQSDDPHDQVWLGQIYAATDRLAQAERAFRRAVDLAPRDPAMHLHLILFLARSNQATAALTQLRQAEQRLPAEQVPLVHALGYEALGQLELAEQAFRAVVANTRETRSLQMFAEFCLRHGRFAQIEPILRTLATTEDVTVACWARRQLALVCVQTPTAARYDEALRLIHRNLLIQLDQHEDLQVKARILATRPAGRDQAIQLLEQLIAHGPASSEDQFLLARLYETTQQWSKARERYLDLLTADALVSPVHLAHFVSALIERNALDEASRWLGRLEKLQPRDWCTVQFKARLLHLREQTQSAVELLNEYDLSTNNEQIGRQIAALLDQLGQPSASETILRRWYERGHTAQRLVSLAMQVGKLGRLNEALDLCERVDSAASAEAGAVAVLAVLRHPAATQQQFDRGQRWLETWLSQQPQSLPLLLGLAELHSLRGRHEQAQQVYQRVILRDPHNLAALNNWACQLVLRGRHSEAMPLVSRAIASHGELPALIETRGLIHLEAGRLEAAVSDFEQAIAAEPTATRYFHLARGHLARRERAAARQALERAAQLGLTPHDLHPLERVHFERLWPLRDES